MTKIKTISAALVSIALMSAQLPAQASVNPQTFENNISQVNSNLENFKMDLGIEQTAAQSLDALPVQVAWSLKSAGKKIGRAGKKVGRATKRGGRAVGRGIRKANRVVVPAEVRRGASWSYRKTKRGGRYIGKALRSYKRCISPGCGRIGDLPNPRDHRT